MTNEERQLLLQDLCARLPYGLLVKTPDHYSPQVVNSISDNLEVIVQKNLGYSLLYEAKPYLRPMSSMTEEEREELKDICTMCNDEPNSTYEYFGIEIFHISRYGTNFESDYTAIDWLNSHHFDYRGLIHRGLALPAKEGMYD